MDKEPSSTFILVASIIASIAAFLAARYRPWLLLLVLPYPALLLYGVSYELSDPSVGPAIRLEAGPFYEQVFWSMVVLLICAPLLGLAARLWRSAAKPVV